MAVSYRKANIQVLKFFVAGSNIRQDSTWTKAWVITADLIDLDGNMHSYALSSCDIKASVVS